MELQVKKEQQPYCTFLDLDASRIIVNSFEQRPIPNHSAGGNNQANSTQYYYQMLLMYNFGTPENKAINDFLFEGCELTSSTGIQSKVSAFGRNEYSIMCKFDINNEDQKRYLNCIDTIYQSCAQALSPVRVQVKIPNFSIKMPEATGLRDPIYRPRDEVTGDVIQGRAPSCFLKLFSRGKPPLVEQTLFTDLAGKAISWELLQSVEMRFVPLIRYKKIYIGGQKASIQLEVQSAVITFVRPRCTATLQTSTIESLNQARPGLMDEVSAQLARITTDRQDKLLTNSAAPSEEQSNTEPTYSGIAPPQKLVTQEEPGSIPSIPNTMQEFTSNAPIRTRPKYT